MYFIFRTLVFQPQGRLMCKAFNKYVMEKVYLIFYFPIKTKALNGSFLISDR